MLLFRSEDEIDAWRHATGKPRGEVLTLPRVWALAQRWYGERLSPRYRGRSANEAAAIFAELGLTSPFWR